MESDPWVEQLREALKDQAACTVGMAVIILRLEEWAVDRSVVLRITKCLRAMGWTARVEWVNGRPKRVHHPENWRWLNELARQNILKN